MSARRLCVVRVELAEANAFVAAHHRHHRPVVGHRFSLGAAVETRLVGVVIVGRPVARAEDQRRVAEVTRLCTDGTPNACSFLYGAAARAALALGFCRIQTYILDAEPGISLRAAGWRCLGVVRRDGAGWNNRAGRKTDQPTCAKQKWVKELSPPLVLDAPARETAAPEQGEMFEEPGT